MYPQLMGAACDGREQHARMAILIANDAIMRVGRPTVLLANTLSRTVCGIGRKRQPDIALLANG